MRCFSNAVKYLKSGFVITIKKENSNYDSYILKYDGNLFKDTFIIELGEILNQFPNIIEQLNNGFSYHVIYDFENKQYQMTIIDQDHNRIQKALFQKEILEDYQVFSKKLLDGMIELDTKIGQQRSEDKNTNKQKRLVS